MERHDFNSVEEILLGAIDKIERHVAEGSVPAHIKTERERCLAWLEWIAQSETYDWYADEMEHYPNGRVFSGIRDGTNPPKS